MPWPSFTENQKGPLIAFALIQKLLAISMELSIDYLSSLDKTFTIRGSSFDRVTFSCCLLEKKMQMLTGSELDGCFPFPFSVRSRWPSLKKCTSSSSTALGAAEEAGAEGIEDLEVVEAAAGVVAAEAVEGEVSEIWMPLRLPSKATFSGVSIRAVAEAMAKSWSKMMALPASGFQFLA